MSEYKNFISSKAVKRLGLGFDVDLNPDEECLFDFQAFIVNRAIKEGRFAIFSGTGTGKTRMYAVWMKHITRLAQGEGLIVAPLCVAQQSVIEAERIGIKIKYCRKQDEVEVGVITITNYEMLEHFDPDYFMAVVLDESSILKSFMGSTKQKIISMFKGTKYKLACTATPSPNDHMELGNHADFLGVMRSNEMLSRYFVNDTMKAGGYRLKGHAEGEFWRWVSSWSICIESPSDLGFDGSKYVLPPLNEVVVDSAFDNSALPEGQLCFADSLSATQIHSVMRKTAPQRAMEAAKLIAAAPDESWLVWCNTNYEADELRKCIPSLVEVRGNEKIDVKSKKLLGFLVGEPLHLLTKPKIAGFGMNFQHCHNMIFLGLSYSYEAYHQAVRRCYRFGQTKPVNAYIISTEAENGIISAIARKKGQHDEMRKKMINAIYDAEKANDNTTNNGVMAKFTMPGVTLYQGDSCQVMAEVKDDSVGFSIFSPPFSNLYIYSDAVEDMGNSANDDEFFKHFEFLAREIYRATIPGRLVAIHCKDLPAYMGRDDYAGLRDFPGDIIRLFEKCNWRFHSRVTIWKDPVIEMQRTKNHGLLYKQLCKDSAASRQGMADYMIIMRKWSEGERYPVTTGGERFFDYVGAFPPLMKQETILVENECECITGDEGCPCGCEDDGFEYLEKDWVKPEGYETANRHDDADKKRRFSINVWQRYASPVWFDIRQTDVLNVKSARTAGDEKHICPLQLDVIERSIELWSNPGDLVLSPFLGIGSEGYVAVKTKRKFVGIELKPSYFDQAVRNIKAATSSGSQMAMDFGDE